MTMIGAAVLQVAPPRPDQRAWAQSGSQAVTFVKSTSEQLVAIVNGVGTPQESTNGCRRLSNSAVDVNDIARFCLGRFWRIATPDQQQQYMAL